MTRSHIRLISFTVAAVLASCSLAPRYERPAVPTSGAYKEQAGAWQPAAPADAESRGAWWEVFNDAELNSLEAQLNDANQDLRGALARYVQARAIARQSISDLFPTIDLNGSAVRAKSSGDSAAGGAIRNNFSLTANLSWEIDLLGRLRNAASAARRRAEASAGDLASLQLALQAELATAYFSLRGADSEYMLLLDSVSAYERALDLTRHRYEGGVSAQIDVDQAETQLQSARAQMAEVRLQRAQLEHAIAVLLGRAPSDFTLAAGAFKAEPPPLTAGIPSALLQRRPDIASSERLVAAANAQIGIARAAWFPVFSLGAAAGYQSTATSTLFRSTNDVWSLGPQLALPLIDAGGRAALNTQARAEYDEAVANYRKTVLTAYQEVEDNLAALRHLADAVSAEDAAAAAAQRALSHSNQRYSAGVADYIEVTSVQTAALQAQRAALDARVRRINAAVQLVRALGGGWSTDDGLR